MAFPHNAITSMDEPILVKRPRFRMAWGQIPAYIKEFGKPREARNQMDKPALCPSREIFVWAKITPSERTSPKTVQTINAFFWDIKRGINRIPSK